MSVLAAVAILLPFSRGLTRRVFELIRSMKEFEAGNRKVRASSGYRDEIGQLIGIFNGMANTIDHLITETLEARIAVQQAELERTRMESARNEARLQALQSIINPHYLFNTLESIRMRTLLSGDRRTANVIQRFATTFREFIASTSAMIPLERELELVDAFIAVQKYRFGRRLSYSVQCDESIMQVQVPRFIAQPLVENAVFHGLEQKRGRGEVKLEIAPRNGAVAIRVTDDGLGMEPDRLGEVRDLAGAAAERAAKSALGNIYLRLCLLYGKRFRFEIESARGRGTEVLIEIPGG